MRPRTHGTSPFYNESSPWTDGTCSATFFPLHTCRKCLSLIMTTPQVRCRGCNRGFTHTGLALHLSKTRDVRCREISITLRDPVVSISIPCTASPPPLDPLLASSNLNPDASLGIGYSRDELGASGIDGDFNMLSPDGMSAATCVVNQ